MGVGLVTNPIWSWRSKQHQFCVWGILSPAPYTCNMYHMEPCRVLGADICRQSVTMIGPTQFFMQPEPHIPQLRVGAESDECEYISTAKPHPHPHRQYQWWGLLAKAWQAACRPQGDIDYFYSVNWQSLFGWCNEDRWFWSLPCTARRREWGGGEESNIRDWRHTPLRP